MSNEQIRAQFNIPDDFSYLNCSTMGPQPRAATDISRGFLEGKEQPWNFQHNIFFEMVEELREKLGALTNSSSRNFAIIPSVGYGISLAAKILSKRVAPGDILVLDEQFPSNIYPWRALAAEGFSVKTLKRNYTEPLIDQVLGALDKKTALVAVPNAHWSDGQLLDLDRLIPELRNRNLPILVDGVQSLGIHPTDLGVEPPDFFVTGFYKWMLGPYGLGAMYIHEKYFDAEPLEQAWMNRVGSENLRELTNYTDEQKDSAARFDMGGKSFVNVSLAGASAGKILEWGVETMQDVAKSVTDKIQSELEELGFGMLAKEHRCDHILGVTARNGEWDIELIEKLHQRNISAALRGDRLRISPNVYNTLEDADKLVSALRELA